MRRGLVVLVSLVLLASAASAADGPRPHVTVITDSVGASLGWDAAATRIFEHGIDADLELKGCRRLTTQSCPAGSGIPPNALELIRSLGRRIGPNVVIAVGYNDFPAVYAGGIEPTLRALRAAGVEHVFWLTLAAVRHPYVATNEAITAAAARHPEVTLVDWNAYSRGHADWFGPDGVHLTGAGAQALARCMHDAVLKVLLAPPPVVIDASLDFPSETVAPGFAARLRADGGTAPYRFWVRGLPAGLHVTRDGRISGPSVPSGSFRLRVKILDATGHAGRAEVLLSVSRARS